MLWTLIVLLLLFWVLGFAFHVAGGIIHVLLVIAVVLFLVNLHLGATNRDLKSAIVVRMDVFVIPVGLGPVRAVLRAPSRRRSPRRARAESSDASVTVLR